MGVAWRRSAPFYRLRWEEEQEQAAAERAAREEKEQ
jgi:hypothetical protein